MRLLLRLPLVGVCFALANASVRFARWLRAWRGSSTLTVMRSLRFLVAGGTILLVLHLFMLGGSGHARTGMVLPERPGAPVATMPAMPAGGQLLMAAGGQLLAAAAQAHDMLTTCLAVLGGLLLAGMLATLVTRRTPPPLARRVARAPVDQPPTPPPIVWGISRT